MPHRVRLALILSSLLPLAAASAQEPADLVIRRATVHTVDATLPEADAFAVKDGRFAAVGSDAQIEAWIGPKTRVLDLAGKTVVPGFIDSHCHPGAVYPEGSRWAQVDCRPGNVKDLDALIAALKAKAATLPEGEWVLGARYQDKKLGRNPTRWDLDRASTTHPIIIGHASGHQSACNSLALKLAKVTAATPDPKGGRFGRDEKGEPDGLLQEGAASVVRGAIARRASPSAEETLAAYREGFRRYLAAGVTSVGVAGASPTFARYLQRVRTDDLPLRLNLMLSSDSNKEAVRRKPETTDFVRYGSIKAFHGGSVSAHTCWVSEPYVGKPDDFGLKPARSQAALDKLVLDIHQAGLQVCMHTNGDREIDMVLTAFERALQQSPRADHRHRLEHCSVLTPALIQRIKALNVVVVPHSYLWELGDTMEPYGEQRWERMHAWRSLLEAGIPMAAHSDSPVSTADPLLQIQAMMTRRSAEGKTYGPGQCISFPQALHAWTLGGAYASFEEDAKGSISKGKLADFVVLAADPAQADPATIKDIVREMTFVGGRQVHPR